MDPMVSGMITVWGIIFVVSVFLGLEWFGRRKERQSKRGPKA